MKTEAEFVPDNIRELNIARDLRHTPEYGDGSGAWVMHVRYLVKALAAARLGAPPHADAPPRCPEIHIGSQISDAGQCVLLAGHTGRHQLGADAPRSTPAPLPSEQAIAAFIEEPKGWRGDYEPKEPLRCKRHKPCPHFVSDTRLHGYCSDCAAAIFSLTFAAGSEGDVPAPPQTPEYHSGNNEAETPGGVDVPSAMFAAGFAAAVPPGAADAREPQAQKEIPAAEVELGLNIDMTDVFRLQEYARLIETFGADITHWGSTEHVVKTLRDLAERMDTEVRQVGELRRLVAPAAPRDETPPAANPQPTFINPGGPTSRCRICHYPLPCGCVAIESAKDWATPRNEGEQK